MTAISQKSYRPQAVTQESQRREIKAFLADVHLYLAKLTPHNLTPVQEKTYDWYKKVERLVNEDAHADVAKIVSDTIIPFLMEQVKDPDQFIPEWLPDFKVFPQFREIATRRHLYQFLTQLDKVREASLLGDEMTLRIRDWTQIFRKTLALTPWGAQEVHDKCIKLLYPLLVDHFDTREFARPLDEEAFLGSDQNTYGKMSLICFLHDLPEELHHKMPLAPDSPESFITRPHPVVRHLFTWLNAHQIVLPGIPELKKQYDAIMNSGKMPPEIPTEQSERRRLERERDQLKEAEAQKKREQLNKKILIGKIAQQIEMDDDEFLTQVNLIHQMHRDRMDVRDKKQAEQLEKIEKLAEDYLEKIGELEPIVFDLQVDLQDLKTRSDQNEKEINELDKDVTAFAEEIKKSKQRYLKQLAYAVATVAVCWGTTWVLSTILETPIAIAPTQNGLRAFGRC